MNELTESGIKTVSTYKVTSADTDMYARLRPGAAVNFLIQSAIDSADKLGFGYGGIRSQNLFWVLSRLTLELYRPLKWYEITEIETWPKNVERILYIRDFILRDINGEVVGKATSGWLAVDLLTKKIKKIDGVDAGYFDYLKSHHALEKSPEKLYPVTEGETFDVTAAYFDIDLNGHVTTTRYVDWIMESFPREFHKSNYPVKLSLNMIKEVMPDETIRIKRKSAGNGEYFFDGTNLRKEKTAFRASLTFD